MEDKLELKHWASYLPHKVQLKYCVNKGTAWTLDETNINSITIHDRLILRPISDLRKDEYFDLYMDLCENLEMVNCENLLLALEKNNYYAIDIQKYHILEEFMYKNHFDWKHKLIEKGLAIDINSLQK